MPLLLEFLITVFVISMLVEILKFTIKWMTKNWKITIAMIVIITIIIKFL